MIHPGSAVSVINLEPDDRIGCPICGTPVYWIAAHSATRVVRSLECGHDVTDQFRHEVTP